MSLSSSSVSGLRACILRKTPESGATVQSPKPGASIHMAAPLHRWDEIALEKITEMVSRKIVSGDREMLAQTYLKRGALVPIHTHESEQMTYILQGALRFHVDGEEVIVREGEVQI